MKTYLKTIVIILAVLITAVSCEEPDYTYTGPPVAEFAPLSTSSTYTSAFTVSVKQANYAALTDTLEITVNLVGPQRQDDISLEYSLVTDTVKNFPASGYMILPTTAVEGTHFSFVPARTGGANGVITIPANSSKGVIKLNSIAAQVAPDVSKRVTLKLVSTNDLNVNPNFQYFIITITRL